MGIFRLGTLSSVAASLRPDLLADPTRAALSHAGLSEEVGVVEIDPALSDTTATRQEYGLELDSLANCVVVGGKREGIERLAACVVLATTRGRERRGQALPGRAQGVLPADRTRRGAHGHGVRRDHAHRPSPGLARTRRLQGHRSDHRRDRVRCAPLQDPSPR